MVAHPGDWVKVRDPREDRFLAGTRPAVSGAWCWGLDLVDLARSKKDVEPPPSNELSSHACGLLTRSSHRGIFRGMRRRPEWANLVQSAKPSGIPSAGGHAKGQLVFPFDRETAAFG